MKMKLDRYRAPKVDPDNAISFIAIAKISDNIIHHMSISRADNLPIAGNEGIGDFFKGVIMSLSDTIYQIAHSFKTNIFKFYKKLKRSEIREYNESNSLAVKEILRTSYDRFYDVKIPYPEKMSSPYDETSAELYQFLNWLDMPVKLKGVKANLENIIKSLEGSEETNILATRSKIDLNITELTKAFAKCNKCFKGGKSDKPIEFQKLFKKTTSLNDTNEALLNAEKHFQDINSVNNTLESMEELMSDFVKKYEAGSIKIVDKKIFNNLAVYCKEIALMCDMYGVAIQDLARVEHNLVEVFEVLRKIIK